jgi:hypothetical protein
MKTQYIVPESHTFGFHHYFRSWVSIPMPDGRHLLSVEFHNSNRQESFEEMEVVEPLPHPSLNAQVSAAHADALKHLGVKPGHTTRDVIKAARNITKAF